MPKDNELILDGFTLEVVPVHGPVHWAVKATINGESRYRGYYYKAEALKGMQEWVAYQPAMYFRREFYHNFDTAEKLVIQEVQS